MIDQQIKPKLPGVWLAAIKSKCWWALTSLTIYFSLPGLLKYETIYQPMLTTLLPTYHTTDLVPYTTEVMNELGLQITKLYRNIQAMAHYGSLFRTLPL